eukprot:Nitzschia sp. Nitz4//scaffold136_size62208//36921//40785//NITZ4_006373-RA/size62208-augustus-gene-0.1-mRNA-1//1//CDS//3329535633//3204//frame0
MEDSKQESTATSGTTGSEDSTTAPNHGSSSGAQPLLGLFDPPPSLPPMPAAPMARSTTMTTSNQSNQNNPSNQRQQQRRQQPSTTNPLPDEAPTPLMTKNLAGAASSLSSMFDPPPTVPTLPSPEKAQLLLPTNLFVDPATEQQPSTTTSNVKTSYQSIQDTNKQPTVMQQQQQQRQLQQEQESESQPLLEQWVPINFLDQQRDSTDAGAAFQTAKKLRSIPSFSSADRNGPSCWSTLLSSLREALSQPTTYAGSFMFLLYHVVFCLANASAITRPHQPFPSILGLMSRLTALGIIGSAPLYILRLGADIPALYPSTDLFIAPFMAQAAQTIDDILYQEYGPDTPYPDATFLSTFAVLTGLGMAMAGLLLLLAASFKLANLGTYLPYSVLCGFFSAVGVLMWALAFSVDTGGITWKQVLFSGDPSLMMHSLLHHTPSLCMGILMNRLGPKNPFFVLLLVLVTLLSFYLIMIVSGTSLAQAQEDKWFWSPQELIYMQDEDGGGMTSGIGSNATATNTVTDWFLEHTLPPTPFSNLFSVISPHTHWGAVWVGLPEMMAFSILYLLRSSIHASALKKNIGNLVRKVPRQATHEVNGGPTLEESHPTNEAVDAEQDDADWFEATATTQRAINTAQALIGSVRQNIQLVQDSLADQPKPLPPVPEGVPVVAMETPENSGESGGPAGGYDEVRAKPSRRTLEEIFQEYGFGLLVVSACGGFGNCPTVATSNTMYAIGAEAAAPQYGSVLLLILFYFTDFEMVQYIPKTAFSSLLVLGAVDTLVVWFIGPFGKTQDYVEMAVIPIIVLCSLVVGFLNAVFLGIAIAMFIFVGSFFRVGVVKFSATALEIRSRIERSMAQSVWLDSHGDHVQVLVLQNYLFFGNASSIFNYVSTMFEDIDDNLCSSQSSDDLPLPPKPKVVVIDLSLISGMDTSTVDIFAAIKSMCQNHDCKLFLCGLSPRIKRGLALVGVKAERGSRTKRVVRIFPDLDTALGTAEDFLVQTMYVDSSLENEKVPRNDEDGFRFALEQIDLLHAKEFADDLMELSKHVIPIRMERGDCLFESDGGIVDESERGLFFIESGLLRVERNSDLSLTMTRSRSSIGLSSYEPLKTLKHQHARMGTIGRRVAMLKNGIANNPIRIARIGPGWVIGTVENATGLRQSGTVVAASPCKLYHLTFDRLESLEKDDPILVLRLYKMLAHLMARREEISILHMSTLQTILTSPAHGEPVNRAALTAMARAAGP